jgi:uncharacterized protein YndB with AHSA1/START domain
MLTREFEAPIGLIFEALTKPEHVIKTIAPFGEEVVKCEIDLRVGGDYHYIFLADDGTEMSFRGTFLELDPPRRSVQTWVYDGWAAVEAVESVELAETDGVTTMTYRLTFGDRAGRDHMQATDGLESNFDNLEALLLALLEDRA